MCSHFPQGLRSPSKLISDVSETNVRFARRFPALSGLDVVDAARDGALATGMQKRMDAGFNRLDAYLQTIS
jgi:hypothetical protein